MKTLRLRTSLFLFLAALVATPGAVAADKPGAARIKKCQDAAGKWHYGDTADDECARSKVIEMNQRGVQTREINAPLTEKQMRAQEQQRTREEDARKQQAEQERRDQLLLATYGHEDDINLARDRRLADIESQIRGSQETLTSLRGAQGRLQQQAQDEQKKEGKVSEQTAKNLANTDAQIAKHEGFITQKRGEQDALRGQYDAELRRFRELKAKQTQPAPAKK